MNNHERISLFARTLAGTNLSRKDAAIALRALYQSLWRGWIDRDDYDDVIEKAMRRFDFNRNMIAKTEADNIRRRFRNGTRVFTTNMRFAVVVDDCVAVDNWDGFIGVREDGRNETVWFETHQLVSDTQQNIESKLREHVLDKARPQLTDDDFSAAAHYCRAGQLTFWASIHKLSLWAREERRATECANNEARHNEQDYV